LKGEVRLHLLSTDRPEEVLGPGRHALADGRFVDVVELVERNGQWSWMLGPDWPPEKIQSLTGGIIVIEQEKLPERADDLEEGEYSEADIIGLSVEDTLGRKRGRVVRIERRYEVDTWIVENDKGQQGQLAAVGVFIKNVDLECGVITVTPNSILHD